VRLGEGLRIFPVRGLGALFTIGLFAVHYMGLCIIFALLLRKKYAM